MEEYSPLVLYKASAGSGKTFILAVRYISFLVRNPQAYRHILAVTFTNKATAEMKQRIMSQLYGISHGIAESAAYFSAVRKLTPASYSDNTIRDNAGIALKLILQDYGSFRVETIDSFFQSVLRGLARELQLGSNLSIELDVESVISDAVDSFLANLDPKSGEKDYVLDFVQDNIDNDKRWNVDLRLKEFSRQLFSEAFMGKSDLLKDILEKPDAIRTYSRKMRKRRDDMAEELTKKLIRCGERIKSEIERKGYPIDTLASNAGKLIVSLIDGSFLSKPAGKTIGNSVANPSGIFKKAQLKADPSLEQFTAGITAPLFNEAANIHDEYDKYANSFNAALRYLNELALILAIRREINRQNNEEGRFVLADTAHLLSSLTVDDTSFVFEKTGSTFRHLMIDEFQDTSMMQWMNMSLLLHECLSQGKECLVVGDVKQSIYRWRGGDWSILNTGIEKEFATYRPRTERLTANRRSHANIVNFNNELFPLAERILNESFQNQFNRNHESMSQAYSDVMQEYPVRDTDGEPYKPDGNVRVRLLRECGKDSDTTAMAMQMLEEELDRLTGAGIALSDITILLRNKKDIASIAGYFASERPEYKMVSGEAFQLDSSPAVRIIVNALRWINDDKDQIAISSLVFEWSGLVLGRDTDFLEIMSDDPARMLPGEIPGKREALRNTPLYELTDKLYKILELEKIPGQDAYLLAFMDIVKDFSSTGSSDIAGFIKEWDGKLHKKSIPQDTADSIRLMTIHASKGLEFHTVIIPHCDWTLCKSGDNLWCEPDVEPFNEIPLLPVGYYQELANSIFSDDFIDETGRQMVDNLNLLYVAATRPKCNMVILSANPQSKSGDKISRISDIMAGALCSDKFGCAVDGNGMIEYEYGNLIPSKEQKDAYSENPLNTIPEQGKTAMKSYNMQAGFRQSGESVRFVHSAADTADSGDIRQQGYIDSGRLMHQLMSAVNTPEDIDTQIESLLSQGLIESHSKAAEISRLLHEAVTEPEVSEWFDGHWTIFYETSVLFRHNGISQSRRPDRVMCDRNGTIVVDFKFGREREEYLHQVSEYMDLLRDMGYQNVKGYVWYIYLKKTIKVI